MGSAVCVMALLAASSLLAAAGSVAHHEKSKKAIAPVDRSDASATHLARSILEGGSPDLVRSKFVTVPPGGEPVAIGSRPLAGFPRKGGSFAILSTGCALLADNPNKNGYLGCRNGGVKTRGARDVVIWRIRVKVPQGANCLSFRFKFLSDEYPEWVGSEYNDALIAEVGRSPGWKASGNQDPTITAPRNFATTRDGNLISVNGTGVARVTRKAAKGTTYDAATGKLRASTRVKPGSRLLYISIFDQGDRQYDSAVFIDRLIVRKAANCRSGVVGSK
ncbi:MAG TPA: choice-of-anchor L domain-containing protein [Solirubrobacterales bacterium]|nr:choice-of-anchor L domain-containing protein [Solirubrobacterales bacterium]